MQEVREELHRRLDTIGNQIVRCQEDREEHVLEIARIDRQIERHRILETQYQQVLDTIPAPA